MYVTIGLAASMHLNEDQQMPNAESKKASPRTRPLTVISGGAALLFSALAGCVTARFEQVAQSAAAQASSCPSQHMTKLKDWAFRSEGCDQITYWRCWTKGVRPNPCCRRVETEQDAVKLFTPALDHPGAPYPESVRCE